MNKLIHVKYNTYHHHHSSSKKPASHMEQRTLSPTFDAATVFHAGPAISQSSGASHAGDTPRLPFLILVLPDDAALARGLAHLVLSVPSTCLYNQNMGIHGVWAFKKTHGCTSVPSHLANSGNVYLKVQFQV